MANPGPNTVSDSLKTQLSNANSDGAVLGQSTSDLVGIHGVTPTIQRASASQAAVATTGASSSSPYGFTTAAQANAIVTLVNEIRAAMVEKGLIKGSA